jgi:hypothetical protein
MYRLISQEADWDSHQNDVTIDAPVGLAVAWAWVENVDGSVLASTDGVVEPVISTLPLVGDAVTSVVFHPPDTTSRTVHAVCVSVVL